MRSLRTAGHLILALLPSVVKIPLYRWICGYRIGRGVRIGFSPFVRVARCTICDGARIGHLNLFIDIAEIEVGERVEIGFLNVFRGGRRISIGSYSSILRRNVLNSIPVPDLVNEAVPELDLGIGTVVTSGHWIDFTDRVRIGAHSIVGGRNSSFWTHNRQRTRPIEVGHHCYFGSEVRVAPGTEVRELTIVALGSVLTGRFETERVLLAGNPATVQRALREDDLFLVTRKTRNDIPDEIAAAGLAEESATVAVT
jgi:acetyltransferase-like isoleucine patch superfamily enzyme